MLMPPADSSSSPIFPLRERPSRLGPVHRPGPVLALLLVTQACSVQSPVPVAEQEPIPYPLDAWEAGLEGEVSVYVLVTAEGTVDSVEMRRSSGEHVLDSAAVEGARGLLFEPARSGDQAVSAWVAVPVIFEKTDSGGTPEGSG